MNTENSLEINTKKLLMAYQNKKFDEAKNIAISMTKEFPNYMYLAYDQMMVIGTSSIPIVILTSTFNLLIR